MTRAALMRKPDIKRAIEAVRDAGVRIGRIELDAAGGLVIIPAHPDDLGQPQGQSCEILDKLAGRA